jgi:uncharacterized membrane protein
MSTEIDETVEHLAAMHREHERDTTPVQRFAIQITNILGRPSALGVTLLLVIVWMVGNYTLRRLGIAAVEDFPFPDLSFIATIVALLIALLILTTQQHQNVLAERRSQLTLQIAILSEKKIAKVIQLIEEQRRENPMLSSRIDEEADAMALPADPTESMHSLDRAVSKSESTSER